MTDSDVDVVGDNDGDDNTTPITIKVTARKPNNSTPPTAVSVPRIGAQRASVVREVSSQGPSPAAVVVVTSGASGLAASGRAPDGSRTLTAALSPAVTSIRRP